MMQVPVDEVVDMVAVRHRFVPAVWAVHVRRSVPFARVVWRAVGRVVATDRHLVLVDVVAMNVVEMTVVEVVHVTVVLDGSVTTPRTVCVVVGKVGIAGHRASFVGVTLAIEGRCGLGATQRSGRLRRQAARTRPTNPYAPIGITRRLMRLISIDCETVS